jgi:predicted HicB family RNase H-like nuclease
MKLKTIYINEDLHTELKVYCAKNKLKLNQYVEEILRAYQKTKK